MSEDFRKLFECHGCDVVVRSQSLPRAWVRMTAWGPDRLYHRHFHRDSCLAAYMHIYALADPLEYEREAEDLRSAISEAREHLECGAHSCGATAAREVLDKATSR